ncbi:hypothetical protein GWI33_010743 [Rhynchophorus ferrugineus]|uniref:Uncharacterized protein n=1 Tax=Rhynchophorus ferrugineus TaxID=354439 RepID=A0A834IAM9_RHYFE|nr:hypothetical protein GWI33_010743 [Rhynchophorus ferrugineus]
MSVLFGLNHKIPVIQIKNKDYGHIVGVLPQQLYYPYGLLIKTEPERPLPNCTGYPTVRISMPPLSWRPPRRLRVGSWRGPRTSVEFLTEPGLGPAISIFGAAAIDFEFAAPSAAAD